MALILKTIGQNIRNRRKQLHMTQQELADRMNDAAAELGYDVEYGIDVNTMQVSRWERGECAMSVVQEDLIIRVLLSNAADLHGIEFETDLDARLHTAIALMPFRAKEIMYHLLSRWDGNAHALLEANLVYSAIPREGRSLAIEDLLAVYNMYKRMGIISEPTMGIAFRYVEQEQEKL